MKKPPGLQRRRHCRALWAAVRHPAFMAGVIGHGFTFMGGIVYSAGAADFVINIMGMGVDDFGWLVVPLIVCTMLGGWRAWRLLRRWGLGRFAWSISVMTAAGLAGIALDWEWVPRVSVAFVCPMIYHFNMAVVRPVMNVMNSTTSRRTAGWRLDPAVLPDDGLCGGVRGAGPDRAGRSLALQRGDGGGGGAHGVAFDRGEAPPGGGGRRRVSFQGSRTYEERQAVMTSAAALSLWRPNFRSSEAPLVIPNGRSALLFATVRIQGVCRSPRPFSCADHDHHTPHPPRLRRPTPAAVPTEEGPTMKLRKTLLALSAVAAMTFAAPRWRSVREDPRHGRHHRRVGREGDRHDGLKAGAIGIQTLIDAVPQMKDYAEVSGEQVVSISSNNVTTEIRLKLANRVNELLADPEGGRRGDHARTDSIEETAYFLNLTVKSDKPVVLVGAMCPATAISADGPMNLLEAVQAAASPKMNGQGVTIIMNNRIGAARETTSSTPRTSTPSARPNTGGWAS